jgi:hypothetical protein
MGWQALSMTADKGYTFPPALRDFHIYHKTVQPLGTSNQR